MLVLLLSLTVAAASPPPLRLADLLEQARRNPEIAAARSRQAAAATVASQVHALPDPMASISYTNESLNEFTLGDSVDSFLTLSWEQELPPRGRRRLASDAAMREAEAVARTVTQRESEILSEVKQAYADLYRLDRTSATLGESRQLLVSLLETARVRYETGEGVLQNVLKAQTEIARLDADLGRATQERAAVEASLKALLGDMSPEPLGPAVELPVADPSIDTARLEQEALARSPDVLRAQAVSVAGEARLEAARGELKSGFSYGAAYSYRGDLDPMVMGMFGMRLPLYRKTKQAQGVVQASAERDAAGQELAAARLRVVAEVRALAARADRAAALAGIYEQSIIPQAQSSFESARAAYGVGRVDFLTLLNDFTALLQYELTFEQQRAERVSALAGLERLTTLPLLHDPEQEAPASESAP
jgi:cobalt-zinc-cadmium efflux system outer membrane protein